jgi:hypothetical protein
MNDTLTKLQEHLKNISAEEFQKEWNEIKKMKFDDGVSVNDFFKNQYNPPLLEWIEKMFEHAKQKQWYETYWFFDLHGVISIPDYRKIVKEINYYPYVKETLQFLTNNRSDIIMILFTSSYPDEIKTYINILEKDGIHFKYINENPEISDDKGAFGCYDKKPYYNVLLDDKASFNPETDWKPIYDYFVNSEYRPNPNWNLKTVEKYHK